ncbi:MAG TPA: methionine adenosyltransferase [Candidatus Akkermansia intestinigallinarum]|uniref:S-adenosylmethionine synthase n=1 Tax=Candidatus Akkermansia intestinigallinarum TaxID=2838431 RepID=A0A9D1V9N4_9BACT|nr:methionine adenosyltransferase [Candidatus Akkermansia intestinigallinarum]
MKHLHIFTSESVGEGHPDKVADLISDSILDACLEQDPDSRVACETLVKDSHVILAGEITTQARVDYEAIVRDTIRAIGYRNAGDDPVFNAESVDITNYLSTQSPDIAQGVDAREADGKEGSEQGAGDQGIMFGYASNETPELMPAPIMFSHRIMIELARVRHSGEVAWLRPDSKSQVAVEYGADGKPSRILNVVLSTQHTEDVDNDTIRRFCRELICRVLPAELITPETEFYINPTGRFVIGGPHGDSGLTGRKIIVDTYGGMGRHGGGAFSGKDCSKVDRSGAYMCRWVAKHIVAAGLADRCELQVAYAIGKAAPVSIMLDVQTYGTSKLPEEEIIRRVNKAFSFKPADMTAALGLKRPIFKRTTNYGHFTKADLPWEMLDAQKLEILRQG